MEYEGIFRPRVHSMGGMLLVKAFAMETTQPYCVVSFVRKGVVWLKTIHHPEGHIYALGFYLNWKVRTKQLHT